jgi:hypothetical protein
MAWPIPVLSTPQRPAPVGKGMWFFTFVATLALGASTLAMMWPHEKSTHTPSFWMLVIGAPICTFALIFGLRLRRWESQHLLAEEGELEQARLNGMWRAWATRYVPVVQAATFFPSGVEVDQLLADGPALPCNIKRAAALGWPSTQLVRGRCATLLNLVAERFKDNLTASRLVEVTLVLADASRHQQEQWLGEARTALLAAAPAVAFDISVATSADCVAWIDENVDQAELPARLIVCAQLWPDDGEADFSEAAAALLFAPRTQRKGCRRPLSELPVLRVLRPMTSESATLAVDVRQMLDLQVMDKPISRAWTTACDLTTEADLLQALQLPAPLNRQLDRVIGSPGPVSAWVAFAIAVEAGWQDMNYQLFAWGTPGNGKTHVCAIAPALSKGH